MITQKLVKYRGNVDESINTVYIGNILEYTDCHIGGKLYVINNILLKTGKGDRRMFSIALKAGANLYNYLNINDRLNRLSEIKFQFVVIHDRQHVIEYQAFDPNEWIGDTLERERIQREEKELKLLAARKNAIALYSTGIYRLIPNDGK